MKPASRPRRKSTTPAMSSGVPIRPVPLPAIITRIMSPLGPSSSEAPIGVEMIPGEMELTRAPRRPQAIEAVGGGGVRYRVGSEVGEVQELIRRRGGQAELDVGREGRHRPGHRRDEHAGAAGTDDCAEGVEHECRPEEVHPEDGVDRRLHGREPGGVDHGGHRAPVGGLPGQRIDRVLVGDVDGVAHHVVAGLHEVAGLGLQQLLVEVGQHDGRAGADPAGDRGAHTARSGHHDHTSGFAHGPTLEQWVGRRPIPIVRKEIPQVPPRLCR